MKTIQRKVSEWFFLSIIKRCICIVLSITFIAVAFAGCGEKTIQDNTKGYKGNDEASLGSGEIASNGKYSLSWDDEAKSVQLTELANGKVWSNIAYDKYLEGSINANANSSLLIDVTDPVTLQSDTIRSYSALDDGGKIIAQKIDNGLRVTYYFEIQKISVPIDYVLREESLEISVNTNDICEDGDKYLLTAITPAPLLCAANNETENGYLFVPSGCGAIMDTIVKTEGDRSWMGEVYAPDAARRIAEEFTNIEEVRLPVFGAKDEDNAMLAIIEEGAGSTYISANAGNRKVGVSYVGAKIFVRGYDVYWHGSNTFGNSILTQYSKQLDEFKVTIGYYPLQDEDADYNGMAKLYRNYLIESQEFTKSDQEIKPYSVTLLGGTLISESVMGIPTVKLKALTDFESAKEIISSLNSITGAIPFTRLIGYGDCGITAGTLLGGKNIPDVYGNRKQLDSLVEYVEKNSKLIFDTDLLYYSKSGNGVSLTSNAAKTAIKYNATQYDYSPQRLYDKDSAYKVISRSKLDDAMDKAVKKTEKYGFSAMSFSSLTSNLYADFVKTEYSIKANMEQQVLKLMKKASKSGKTVVSSEANSYAAVASDIIFDVSTENGDDNAFIGKIPFYQMVFSGYRPMYSQGINLSDNFDKMVAFCAASGMGLGFVFVDEFIAESNDLDTHKLYAMPYDNNENLIRKIFNDKGYMEYFDKVSGSQIKNYSLEGSISTTVFENGVTVYTNHSETESDSPAGKLGAYEFVIK